MALQLGEDDDLPKKPKLKKKNRKIRGLNRKDNKKDNEYQEEVRA